MRNYTKLFANAGTIGGSPTTNVAFSFDQAQLYANTNYDPGSQVYPTKPVWFPFMKFVLAYWINRSVGSGIENFATGSEPLWLLSSPRSITDDPEWWKEFAASQNWPRGDA